MNRVTPKNRTEPYQIQAQVPYINDVRHFL